MSPVWSISAITVFLEMSGLQRSSSTVGNSSATLARGIEFLDNVASHGVVKVEPDDEESKILDQIKAQHVKSACVCKFSTVTGNR